MPRQPFVLIAGLTFAKYGTRTALSSGHGQTWFGGGGLHWGQRIIILLKTIDKQFMLCLSIISGVSVCSTLATLNKHNNNFTTASLKHTPTYLYPVCKSLSANWEYAISEKDVSQVPSPQQPHPYISCYKTDQPWTWSLLFDFKFHHCLRVGLCLFRKSSGTCILTRVRQTQWYLARAHLYSQT